MPVERSTIYPGCGSIDCLSISIPLSEFSIMEKRRRFKKTIDKPREVRISPERPRRLSAV